MDKEELPRKTGPVGSGPGGNKHPLWVNVSTAILALLILSPIISTVYNRILYLPQPAYNVKTYENLYEVCAPYQMSLPGKDALPYQENKYMVYLATRQRWSQPTGYSIYCDAASGNDVPLLTYQVNCSSRIDKEPYLEYVESWKGIPIYGRFQRVFDTEGNSNWEYYDGFYLQFVLKEHQYSLDVQMYDSEEYRRKEMERPLFVIAQSIIDQSAISQ